MRRVLFRKIRFGTLGCSLDQPAPIHNQVDLRDHACVIRGQEGYGGGNVLWCHSLVERVLIFRSASIAAWRTPNWSVSFSATRGVQT